MTDRRDDDSRLLRVYERGRSAEAEAGEARGWRSPREVAQQNPLVASLLSLLLGGGVAGGALGGLGLGVDETCRAEVAACNVTSGHLVNSVAACNGVLERIVLARPAPTAGLGLVRSREVAAVLPADPLERNAELLVAAESRLDELLR